MDWRMILILTLCVMFLACIAGIVYIGDSQKIRQRVIKQMARKEHISEAYLKEIMDASERFKRGEITSDELEKTYLAIVYKYPKDSGLSELLRKSEMTV